MKSLIAIFVLVSVFHPGLTTQPFSDINDAIFHALDVVLRQEMRTGNPDTGLPILAPFQSPNEEVSMSFGHLVDLDGELRNVRLDGLDTYQIFDVRLSMLTMRLAFDFMWPQLLATGWYNLNGRFAGLIPIYGQGNYRIDPRNLRGSGYADVRFVGPQENLNITHIDVHLNVQSLALDIQGVLGGGDLGAVINKATQDLIPKLLVTHQNEINAFVNDFLLPKINPFLNNLTLDDLTNLMP